MKNLNYTGAALGEPCPMPVRHGVDPRLGDRVWLSNAYAEHGDTWIAVELGCNRKTVRRRRAMFGIPSAPVGPRLGTPRIIPAATPGQYSAVDGLTLAERRLIDQYRSDRRNAPTKELLSRRIVAAHEADAAGDRLAYEAALLDVATAAARIAEHEETLRRAA